MGTDQASKAPSSGELSRDGRRYRATSFDDVGKDSVDCILIKNSEIAISVDIHFEGFQLHAGLIGYIGQSNCSKIRKTGFGANRGIFRNVYRDFIPGILIRPCFEPRQSLADAALGMAFRISGSNAGVGFFHELYSEPRVHKGNG